MTRIAVLGAAGMLGHKMLQTLASQHPDVYGTVRVAKSKAGADVDFISKIAPLRFAVDARDPIAVEAELNRSRPSTIVNCVGVVKQRPIARDPIASIQVNSLFPHLLDRWCAAHGASLIHFSTDCVFSGDKGKYEETDNSDARDLYGRTKYLGEVSTSEASLTLRTSIIGRELSSHLSLVEWLYQQRGGQVHGFTKVLYSGVTTLQASRVVAELIGGSRRLSGLYHLAGPWISKHDLLAKISEQAGLDIEIVPDDTEVSDRTMASDQFTMTTGISIPDWDQMVFDMVNDLTPYERVQS